MPFLFPYFASHGIGAAQYGEVVTAYYLTMCLAEVPTGMLADRFGSKPMLVLGPLLLAAGFGTLVLSPGYAGFLTGEVLLGLGHAVLSGPPIVALYETLRQHGAEHRYLNEESRMQARRLFGTGGSFLLGGALVHLGDADGTAYPAAIVATCALNLLATTFAARLHAPRHERSRTRGAFLPAATHELRKGAVRWLLLYWVVLFTLLRFPFHDYQPYLDEARALEPWFGNAIVVGGIFTALNLVAAPVSALMPRIVARWGRPALFWGMPIALSASLLVMGGERWLADSGGGHRAWCWLAVSMFFVQQLPFAMHWSLLHEFVNHRIGSAARTTVLSVLSLGARAVYGGANLLLFHLQEQRGMAVALGALAVVGGAAIALVLWLRPRGLLRGDGPVDERP